MHQLNISITDDEFKILNLIAKEENIPVTSLYKTIVNPTFQQWKIQKIIELHQKGFIHFKEASNIAGLSLIEFLKKIKESGIEPDFIDEMELASEKLAETLTRSKLFKSPNYIRKTPEKSDI
jgi:predicted HTH domain antitoxin